MWSSIIVLLPLVATSIGHAVPDPSFAHRATHEQQKTLGFPRRLLNSFSQWYTNRSNRKSGDWWNNDEPKERLLDNIARYQDQVVVRFNVSTVEHEKVLRAAADRLFLDIWDFTSNYTDIRLENTRIGTLLSLLPESLQDNHSILIPDLAKRVAATYPSRSMGDDTQFELVLNSRGITPKDSAGTVLPKRSYGVDDLFFRDYQPMSAIVAWMRLLDSMFTGRDLVSMISIGKSYEGRDIPALRVGAERSDPFTQSTPRRTILITGGLHAREWISTSTVNYLAWSFIRLYGKDSMITRVLEEFDIVFVPVLNPDGYQYTWEVDRLWRKSRQRTKMQYCPGFDLDHAFGYRWDAIQHQSDPCSESYGGDQPFQAVEASQLANWAKNETLNGVAFVGYIDLHSYSQQVLYPFSYSCAASPPNWENLFEVAMNLAKHMRLANGEVYTVASACEGAVSGQQKTTFEEQNVRIEAGGGSAIDYFFHELMARYSYQIKLRDTGSYGFLLPSENIVPTGEEVFQAMKYFCDFLMGNNGHEMPGNPVHRKVEERPSSPPEGFELRRRKR